jgi:hypothetical protein
MIGKARRTIQRIQALLNHPGHASEAYDSLTARLEPLDRLARLEAANADLHAKLDNLLHHVTEGQRENRLLLGQLSLPPAAVWRGKPEMRPGEPPASVFTQSVACRQAMFEEPYFSYWAAKLGYTLSYYRKLWEFVFICQALSERGLLSDGRRGLGFGVGEEPLTALFAAFGCRITATDMAPEAAADAGWTETQQYAAGKAGLRQPWLCPEDAFDQRVDFEVCDMNAVPGRFTGFDFCWSACALEHLGSIDQGLAFIERSIGCLKPGGYAVHTTELNLSSNEETLESGGTVLFRRRDLEALAERLQAAGHVVAPLDFSTGDEPLDRYIDAPPYRTDPHLVLALSGYATTSFGLIVQRAP